MFDGSCQKPMRLRCVSNVTRSEISQLILQTNRNGSSPHLKFCLRILSSFPVALWYINQFIVDLPIQHGDFPSNMVIFHSSVNVLWREVQYLSQQKHFFVAFTWDFVIFSFSYLPSASSRVFVEGKALSDNEIELIFRKVPSPWGNRA